MISSLHAAAPFGLDGSDIIFHRKGPEPIARYGWLNVCSIGDINGDYFADFAFSRVLPDSLSLVYYGGNPPDTVPDYRLKGIVWGAGDFTGDGINEVVTSLNCDPLQPRGVVYFYRGYGDSIGSVPYDSLWTVGPNLSRGQVVRIGYIDGDSLCDMVIYQHGNLAPERLIYYSGGVALDTMPDWSYSPPSMRLNIGEYYNDNFGLIDFNGDGHLDIFAGWAIEGYADSIGYVGIFYGPNFKPTPDKTIWLPQDSGFGLANIFSAACVANVNDVTGDGFDDLAVYASYNGISHMLLYKGSPNPDTLFDYITPIGCSKAAAAGDVNGDGYNDLLLGKSHRDAEGGVEILLGGPKFDMTSDGHLVRADLPPYFLQEIGWRIASAGDVNGDGYGDIIFSTDNFSNDYVGDVFVAKGGPDIVTDVSDNNHTAPTTFSLRQNYPNPFNPSTTISYALPSRSRVRLSVFNLLGEEVAVLVDEVQSAGTHSLQWNGTDKRGKAVASGVYLYCLTTDAGSVSRRMVLLR